MKFISIDSSLANTGVAIGEINPKGLVIMDKILLHETKKSNIKQVRASSDTIERTRSTHNFLHSLITSVKPDFIFAETPSGSQSAAGMKSYGATCQLIGSFNPPAIEVTPQEVKMASVGHKKASKDEMIKWAYGKYPNLEWFFHAGKLQNKNEHMADGIAIVYAGIETMEFKRVFSVMNK